MSERNFLIGKTKKLDVQILNTLQHKPALFTPGEALFWDDPHISAQMLETHLDPETDLASRKPETIEKCVAWIMDELGLQAGDALLDLGCGPGLYASRFARRGLQVTGVDYSRRSIAYARGEAERQNLEITYRYENYLNLQDEGLYDAALLIFGDYCVLNPANRQTLLGSVQRALKPGGYFVLDVTTPNLVYHQGDKSRWYATEAGFYRPTPHLVLENGFAYPDERIYLDQYIVIEDSGVVCVYRNWFQDFTREMIVKELAAGGFRVRGVWSDLTGTPYAEGSEWIGVVAQKA